MRIVLLLAVAFVAIVVAATVFSGPPTAAEPEAVAATLTEAEEAEPGTNTEAGSEPPAPPAAATQPGNGASGADGENQQPAGDTTQPGGESNQAPDPAAPATGTSPAPQAPAGDTPTTAEDPPAAAEDPPAGAEDPPTGAAPPVAATEPDSAAPAAAEGTTSSPAAPPQPPVTNTADSAPAAPAAAGEPSVGAAARLIAQLRPLVDDPPAGIPKYDRDNFASWLDTDGDCVNTRHEVLQSEAVGFSMNASGCSVAEGEWFDPYTDRTYTNPRDLDVDHVVALADAWVSGAYAWADELLDRFSNDFGNLNAIAAGENRSKSARGPADYTPSAAGARCDYLVQYATVKIRWQLSITPGDFAATERGLAQCDPDITGSGEIAPAAPTTTPPAPADTPTTTTTVPPGCHPDYSPCLPNLSGNALNCGDLKEDQKPVTVLVPGEDPYGLDRDGDGRGCTS